MPKAPRPPNPIDAARIDGSIQTAPTDRSQPQGPSTAPGRAHIALYCSAPLLRPTTTRSLSEGAGREAGRAQEASQPPTDGRCGWGLAEQRHRSKRGRPSAIKGFGRGCHGPPIVCECEWGHDADAEEERGRQAPLAWMASKGSSARCANRAWLASSGWGDDRKAPHEQRAFVAGNAHSNARAAIVSSPDSDSDPDSRPKAWADQLISIDRSIDSH